MLEKTGSDQAQSPEAVRPLGRSLSEFRMPGTGAPRGLFPAEERLLDMSRTGQILSLAEACPEAATEQNRIRASFVRFLALGGDEEAFVHEKGVQVRGAFIDGTVDLDFVQSPGPLRLLQCHIDGSLHGRNARLVELSWRAVAAVAPFSTTHVLLAAFFWETGLNARVACASPGP